MARSYDAGCRPANSRGGWSTSSPARPPASRPRAGRSQVHNGRASAHQGADNGAKLNIRFTLADFVRIAAGTIDPAEPLLAGRAWFEGDFALAARLPEMFGAPPPY